MKQEIIAGLISIAGATVLGGGTMVLNLHRSDSVQDTQIQELKESQNKLADSVKELNSSVQSLDRGVAVLNERIERK